MKFSILKMQYFWWTEHWTFSGAYEKDFNLPRAPQEVFRKSPEFYLDTTCIL